MNFAHAVVVKNLRNVMVIDSIIAKPRLYNNRASPRAAPLTTTAGSCFILFTNLSHVKL